VRYKFRGKTTSDGLWEYGSLWIESGKYYINGTDNNWWEVIPETVGQYTGLNDKNKNEIYDGDIVRLLCQENRGEWKDFEVVGKVVFAPEFLQFLVADKTGYIEMTNNENYEILEVEVLGNVFENPELLESEVIK